MIYNILICKFCINIKINTNYSDTSEKWTLLKLGLTETNYSTKIFFDQKDRALAGMGFTNMMTANSVFQKDHMKNLSHLLESISEDRKIVKKLLNKNDAYLMNECMFLKNDFQFL